MPGWTSSTRKQTLPSNWGALRTQVLERDSHRCTWIQDGERCPKTATDVDHITPGEDHSPTNLRSLCAPHHRRKSSGEGGRARWAKRKKKSKREERVHPGLLPPPKRRSR